jgi:hypothetical protein
MVLTQVRGRPANGLASVRAGPVHPPLCPDVKREIHSGAFIQPWPHSLEYYNCNPIPEI